MADAQILALCDLLRQPDAASTSACAALWSAYGSGVSALFTMILALGVIVGLIQLYDQRLTTRIIQTPGLIKVWTEADLPAGRALLDKWGDPDRNRCRANVVFARTRRSGRGTKYGKLRIAGADFVHRTARAAERIEVFVRRGAADEGIIAQHLGYGIVMSYYSLQDILRENTPSAERDYEGWRALSLRCQRYANAHVDQTNMSEALRKVDLRAAASN